MRPQCGVLGSEVSVPDAVANNKPTLYYIYGVPYEV